PRLRLVHRRRTSCSNMATADGPTAGVADARPRRGLARHLSARAAAAAPPQRAHAPPDSPRRSRGPVAEGPRAARQLALQPRPRRRGPTRRPTARAAAAAPPQRAHAPPDSPRRRGPAGRVKPDAGPVAAPRARVLSTAPRPPAAPATTPDRRRGAS